MQQGLLFHGMHASQRGRDIEQVIISLPEELDATALESAWARAVERHAILRTAFHWAGAEGPRQEVRRTASLEWKQTDWRELSPERRREAMEDYLVADRDRGFRLETPPLLRLALFQTGQHDYRLVWTYHHLLLDARSMKVLLDEVFSAYEALRSGQEPEWPPVYPYRAYIDWLQAHPRLPAMAFWLEKLRGFREPTPPPVAGGEPLSAESAAVLAPGERELVLSEVFTASCRACTCDRGITLNTLLQGAWSLLLGRHGGVDEVVFGAVRACRHLTVEGIADMVGPTINTVPMRVALPPDAAVTDWLRGLREAWVALRPHETTPLSDIQGWSEMGRSASLFSTLFNFQDPGWDEALQAQGGPWARREFAIRSQPGYPLALDVCGGPRLRIKLLYDRTRFDDATIARLLGHLETLLAGLVAGPDRRLREIPMLKPEERHWLLHGWNDTAEVLPEEATVVRMFTQQVANTPDAPAVTAGGVSVSYAELDQRAERLAGRILARGAGPGALVAVCAERGVDFVAALLAVWKAGAAYVPLDPAHPSGRITTILGEAGCAAVLTSRRFAERLAPGAAAVIRIEDEVPGEETRVPAFTPASADRACVIYTSGSTGRPKGVAISHRGLANLVLWHQRTYSVTPADRATQLASPAFDAAGWEIWPYLASGASVHVPDEETRLAPDRLVRWLHEQTITLCFLPTPLAEATLAETWPRPTSVRAVLTGGDRLHRRPAPDFPTVLINHYGPTECSVVATCGAVAPEGPMMRGTPSIGRPITNTRVHVLDQSLRPVPVGAAGELFIGGAGLAEGYLNQPELTAEKFIADPFDPTPGSRLYRTGDQVRRLQDGTLDFIGRIDDQVKIRGQRVEPGEIESVLGEHPTLAQAAVVAQTGADTTQGLVAFCVASGRAPDTRELRDFLQPRLPEAMIPTAFVFRDELPLTSNGKIDRRLLASQAPGPNGSRPPGTPPETPTEQKLARIWRELLARERVDREDSFFELGGHSLLAMQLIARVRAGFGVELPLSTLFERPTLTALADAIGDAKPARIVTSPGIRRRHRAKPTAPNEV